MRIIFTMNFNSFLDLKDFWQGYELSGLVFKSLRTGEKLVNLARQEQKIRDESGIKEWTTLNKTHYNKLWRRKGLKWNNFKR